MIQQLFKESMSFQFSELSTIKNYFGEKVGFYYAYMSYYTAWLVIPAALGLALTIYQFQGNNVNTIFSSLYALLVCIWVTIFIERWKRKSAEICLKWGVSDILLQNSGETRLMRDEFFGYEYFSHVTYSTEKKNFQGKKAILFMLVSIFIQILLIGATIGVFFANLQLRETVSANPTIEKFKSTIIGVINGVVIAIIDFLYSTIATYFVNIENHKYHDSYEKSYVYKIFIFKFINTNLSLFYTAFSEQDFNQLYYLILGMAITKSVQIFLLKNFKRLALFWLKKRLYFRSVLQSARRRNNQHQSYMNDLQEKQQSRVQNGQGRGPAGD